MSLKLKKLTFITGLSIALSTTLLVGCNKTNNQTDSEQTTDSEQVTEESTAKSNIGSGYATAEYMSIAMFDSLAKSLPSIDQTISSDSKATSCIQNIDHKVVIPTYQEYLKKHLSEEELKKLDEFHASEIGQKQINQMISTVNNLPDLTTEGKKTPEATSLTKEEIAKIQEFMVTPEAQKMLKVIAGDTYLKDGFPNYTLVALDKESKKCNIELPSKDELEQWYENN